MKVIKSIKIKTCEVSLRYVFPNGFAVFVNEQRTTKTVPYDKADVDFCNAVKVLLEV